MTKMISPLIALAIMPFFFAVSAQARGGHHGGKGEGLKQILEKLDLSDEQKTKLKAIRKDNKGERGDKREEMEKAQAAMKKAIADGNEAEIRKVHKQMQDKMASYSSQRIERVISIVKILTPEQRKTFAELQNEKKEHRRKAWKKRRGAKKDDE